MTVTHLIDTVIEMSGHARTGPGQYLPNPAQLNYGSKAENGEARGLDVASAT